MQRYIHPLAFTDISPDQLEKVMADGDALGFPRKGLDPGRAAEHGFQIRKDREGIEVGMHKSEIFDPARTHR
jgi:hypothetical protein